MWTGAMIGVGALLAVWFLAGFAAFVTSFVCFGRSGSLAQKVVGLLLALFFGPFYWLYFVFDKSYCR